MPQFRLSPQRKAVVPDAARRAAEMRNSESMRPGRIMYLEYSLTTLGKPRVLISTHSNALAEESALLLRQLSGSRAERSGRRN